jgi:hypothetical protein
MITSVIYRTVIEYYRDLCPVIRRINDFTKFSDKTKTKSQVERYFYNPEDKQATEVHKKYLLACRKQEGKRMSINDDDKVSVEDMRTLAKIAQRMPDYYPDTDVHEIDVVTEQLYTHKELENWYKMTKQNNYDLQGDIRTFVTKLLKMIQTNSSLK